MSRTSVLDKTLLAIASVAEQSFFSEEFARKRGLLQSLDIRAKLLGFLGILVLISLLRTPQMLWVAYGLSLALAASSRIPLLFYIKRVWLFVPLFSAAVVLPAVLNIVTPGEPLVVLVRLSHGHTWGPYVIPAEIAITRQGLWGAVVLLSRVAASVSFAVLFTLTHRWSDIFSGLRSLFVPRIFVMTLSMTERYLFVFLRMVQDMYRARKSRTIRPRSNAADRRWIASRIGVTYRKSADMSAAVYSAMLSRGFHGDFQPVARGRMTASDWLWLMTVLGIGGIVILFERGLLR